MLHTWCNETVYESQTCCVVHMVSLRLEINITIALVVSNAPIYDCIVDQCLDVWSAACGGSAR